MGFDNDLPTPGIRPGAGGTGLAEWVGWAAIALCFLLGLSVGSCTARRSDAEIEDAALERLLGGTAPSAAQEGVWGFDPSDQPPACLPSGTVTYEAYDRATGMRYWVFRWPEGAGYGVVPRLALGEDGAIVPYEPPLYGAVVTTEGTVGADE